MALLLTIAKYCTLLSLYLMFNFMNIIKETSKSSRQVNEHAATNTDGNSDLAMKSNEAYETVPAQYEEVQFRYRRPQGDTIEYIYDQPAL